MKNPSFPSLPSVQISDRKLKAFEHTTTATIDELVFAKHHLENDALDDAANCLIAVHCNVSSLQDLVAHAQRRAAKPSHHRSHPTPEAA